MDARAATRAYAEGAGAAHYAGRWWSDDERTMVVAFTQDALAHGDAIRALVDTDERIAVVAARSTYAELEAVVEAIDFDELERDGIIVLSAMVDEVENRVEIEVAGAPKERVVAALHARHGDLVHVDVVAPARSREAFAALDGWTPTDDERRIKVHYAKGGRFLRAEVFEGDDAVAVGVVEDSFVGAHATVYVAANAVVELQRPLAGRRVRDAATGRVLPQGRGLR